MVIACPTCQKKNRIHAANAINEVRCGSCQTVLTPIATPIDADVETFDDVVQQSPLPVLVDFWAAWCGPCRMVAPEISDVAKKMAGRALVLKVDTDVHGELAGRYGVRSIPNLVVLVRGQLVKQHAGVVPASQLAQWLEAAATAVA
jgi:thioredoxin 2